MLNRRRINKKTQTIIHVKDSVFEYKNSIHEKYSPIGNRIGLYFFVDILGFPVNLMKGYHFSGKYYQLANWYANCYPDDCVKNGKQVFGYLC